MTTLDLSAPYAGSELTNAEIFYLGEAIARWIITTNRLGHSSPGMTLDYATDLARTGNLVALVARDFIAWTSNRKHLVPEGCEERLAAWTDSLDAAIAAALPIGAAS